MSEVVAEVGKFLAERYGHEYINVNMAFFLAVLTAVYLLYMEYDYEKYALTLRTAYDFIKKHIENGSARLERIL